MRTLAYLALVPCGVHLLLFAVTGAAVDLVFASLWMGTSLLADAVSRQDRF